MIIKWAAMLLAVGAAAGMSGCNTMTNPYAPGRMVYSTTQVLGTVIVSTNLGRCVDPWTDLAVAPAGSAYGRPTHQMPGDLYMYKSDFDDHHGLVSVLSLPAGDYVVYPIVGDARPLNVPQFSFSVGSGEVVYIGNYSTTNACSPMARHYIEDESRRDLDLLRSLNPGFRDSTIVKRLARPGGFILQNQ